MYTSNKLFPGVVETIPSDKQTRGHIFSWDLDWLSCGERWQCLHLLTWHIRSCMLCPAGANGMRSDQGQNKQSSHFFQDLDWLSSGERWQSLHLLIWHVRSCMLCSASSNDMRSDQWQTISVCPHLLPRFRLIAFRQQWLSFYLLVRCSVPVLLYT